MAYSLSSSLNQNAFVVSGRSGNMMTPKIPTGIVMMPKMINNCGSDGEAEQATYPSPASQTRGPVQCRIDRCHHDAREHGAGHSRRRKKTGPLADLSWFVP